VINSFNVKLAERYSLYCCLLFDYQFEEINEGLCVHLIRQYGIQLTDLPELIAQKPKDKLNYWFDKNDNESRIKVIENAIELLNIE
jgi:hypothetical protein